MTRRLATAALMAALLGMPLFAAPAASLLAAAPAPDPDAGPLLAVLPPGADAAALFAAAGARPVGLSDPPLGRLVADDRPADPLPLAERLAAAGAWFALDAAALAGICGVRP